MVLSCVLALLFSLASPTSAAALPSPQPSVDGRAPVVIVSSEVPLSPSASDSEGAFESQLSLAKYQLEAGETTAALNSVQGALSKKPESPSAMYLMSLVLNELGETGPALDLMRVSIEQVGEQANRGLYGELLLINSEYKLAEQQLTLALQHEAKASLYSLRGKASAYGGQAQLAHRDFRRALRMEATAERYHDLGSIYVRLGWNRRALRQLDRSLKMDPFYVPALDERGLVCHNLGRYEEAREDLDLSLSLNSDNYLAWTLRAALRFDLQDFEGAAMDATRAIVLLPRIAQAYHTRGLSLKQLGYLEESEADLLTYQILKDAARP